MDTCPICRRQDIRCKKIAEHLVFCRNSAGQETVEGFVPVGEAITGKGWDWELANIPDSERKIKSLESEFEEVKTKYQQALEKVQELTTEWENALPENKKEVASRLKNAKDILSSLNSTRYVTSNEISRSTKKPKGEAETGFAKDFLVISERVAEHLSYNLLTHDIYFKGEEVKFNSALLWLVETTGFMNWHKGDNTLSLMLLDFAKKNEFCPVKKYLKSIEIDVDHSYLDQCVPFLFGVDTPLAIAAFKAQLVGSVRRIYEPGCHHRLMPILYGEQRKGKSTFLRNLYAGFFSEGDLPTRDKDGCLLIQRCWAHEVAECDTLFRTREASSLKSFVAVTADSFRPPYGRTVEVLPRRSVLWGTTNRNDLFSDSTGNTRYPVIALPTGWQIPTDWVMANRDKIWAAALNGYLTGIGNEIPVELDQDVAAGSKEFFDQDALYEPLELFLANPPEPTLSLMEVGERLGFTKTTFDKSAQVRVAAILRSLGWKTSSVRYAGKIQKRWAREFQPINL